MLIQTIKIGLDIHGVLDGNKDLWKTFLYDLAIARGLYWEIHILTGSRRTRAEGELKALGLFEEVHYHKLHSITDYLLEKKVPELPNSTSDNPWFDPIYWNPAKGEIVKREGIHIIIDDQVSYQPFMPEGTVFLLNQNTK